MKEFFGSYLKKLRLEKGFGLRAFAKKIGIDASFLCHVEHGKQKQPRGADKLLKMAKVLELKEYSDEWNKFFDLSADQPDRLPADIADARKNPVIPLFIRTVQRKRLSRKQLLELVKLVNETY